MSLEHVRRAKAAGPAGDVRRDAPPPGPDGRMARRRPALGAGRRSTRTARPATRGATARSRRRRTTPRSGSTRRCARRSTPRPAAPPCRWDGGRHRHGPRAAHRGGQGASSSGSRSPGSRGSRRRSASSSRPSMRASWTFETVVACPDDRAGPRARAAGTPDRAGLAGGGRPTSSSSIARSAGPWSRWRCARRASATRSTVGRCPAGARDHRQRPGRLRRRGRVADRVRPLWRRPPNGCLRRTRPDTLARMPATPTA